MPALRDATLALDEAINAALGDTITYTPEGGAAATFAAWVEFVDYNLSPGGSAATGEAVTIEVPTSRVAEPVRADRVTIAIRPGVIYAPAAIDPGATGQGWRITLKKVAA